MDALTPGMHQGRTSWPELAIPLDGRLQTSTSRGPTSTPSFVNPSMTASADSQGCLGCYQTGRSGLKATSQRWPSGSWKYPA